VKLYNKTQCPDEIVENLLVRAGRACGKVRTTGVIVIVTAGRTGQVKGMAHECTGVYEFKLRRMKQTRKNGKRVRGRCINTDGGYFAITLPQILPTIVGQTDPLARAENFFQVAIHEWGHIRDYQQGGASLMPWAKRVGGTIFLRGRRQKWEDRPEEKRAIRYTTEANEKIAAGIVQPPDDAILALAVWLESTTNK
jgi:hypothetical protein